ncbi:MAG: lipid-A-disaccharide synthase [Chlamydiia bacterium]|nr:lipid-A-disaccharide synthase [Chlamydiia bacterium]
MPQKNLDLFFFAGERSGDLIGAPLVEELSHFYHVGGVGGDLMQQHPFELLFPTSDFQVMGFIDPIKALPSLIRKFRVIRDYILLNNPKGVILIDYPTFNIKLATALRRRGYQGKIIQYVCPSVWAWKKNRIPKMASCFDLLLTLFPFEPACFSETTLSTHFVGHPLPHTLSQHHYNPDWRQITHLPPHTPILALFPGSREQEIKHNLPLLLETAKSALKHDPHLHIGLNLNHTIPLPERMHIIPSKYRYELMRDAQSAIAKSGTVTLELALQNCPTAVIYQMSFVNRLIAKHFLHLDLPHYCIVNILANQTLFPEMIKTPPTPESLLSAWKPIHYSGKPRETILNGCQTIYTSLNQPKNLAATKILEVLSSFPT